MAELDQISDDLLFDHETELTYLEKTIVLDDTVENEVLGKGTFFNISDRHAAEGGMPVSSLDQSFSALSRSEASFNGGACLGNTSASFIHPAPSPPRDWEQDGMYEEPEEHPELAPTFSQMNSNRPAFLCMPGKINLTDLSDPLLMPTQKPSGPVSIQDEFFGVYCLISRSELKQFKNRCYIGYTVDPNRRIRQHNAGKLHGGAQKTDSRGPWDMVCIIHGFPNAVSGLRFEWAWQNPEKSKRLREIDFKKSRKENPFQFRLRIACHMLNSDPWKRLALTFRWLLPECKIPFPIALPSHIQVMYGKVQKVNTVVPSEINEYTTLNNCYVCDKKITQIKFLLRCFDWERCSAHFHVRCLAEKALESQDQLHQHLVPLAGKCPKCSCSYLWGDLVRDQKNLLQLDESKPKIDGIKMADGMLPIKMLKK
uniref:Structure-specific endonuclease subunit SLX1 homolog n=1 Tax=Ditylenchus dipsaci TaxID=166011 RepID=A0A915D5X8_9BILA